MFRPRPSHWRLHTPRGHRKYLNPEERRRFLAAADCAGPELRAFCHLLAWTGCRLSEALDLVAGDLDPAGSVAIRSLKKRGQPAVREVPVPDQRVTVLMALPAEDAMEAHEPPLVRATHDPKQAGHRAPGRRQDRTD